MRPDSAARFTEVGALHFPAVLGRPDIQRVARLFDNLEGPGDRLSADKLRPIVDLITTTGAIGRVAVALIGAQAKPVRALLLDKSDAANWQLGWHQDRTIAVDERIDVAGFGPWSVKAGQPHVEPPQALTHRMVTLRVHVDGVDERNAPLAILPGTHRMGRLSSDAIDQLAATEKAWRCLAAPGDVWAYATPIVHSSARQLRSGRRRVLQLDFSTDELPGGLKWAKLTPNASA